ncbi:hypothetical protein [Lysobacter changpingensis]|uniref:hypothetical protein n=1 Tax=Lysobacter changpingensis TaxID=2792784 RepID=UPI001A8ECD2D|nr:hypothetical protein [Lysobacter changpingensis]
MDCDDKVGDDRGLVICLRDMGNGTSRLFLDDVIADRHANPINWSYGSFYTVTPEFDNARIEDMALSPEDFERIGVSVVARLLASAKRAR